MRRKAFSALECFNVCLCVSQKCGSAAARLHFMGKSVSHHCVLSGCQTLTGLVGCVCVCVCVRARVCVWRTDAAGFREQQHRKRQSSDRVGASMVKAGKECPAAFLLQFSFSILWLRSVDVLCF